MRYGPEHKGAARTKILDAAGRGFRRLGFGGVGVDGLAKEAGVTSGAFYGHFPSKAEAFKAAAVAGLVQLREGVESLQASEGRRVARKIRRFLPECQTHLRSRRELRVTKSDAGSDACRS